MSVYSDLIAAAKADVDNVTNAGRVHAYNRVLAAWEKYLEEFKTTISGKAQIRGWVVTMRTQSPITPEPDAFGSIARVYHLRIYGFLGVQDAQNTEATFLDLTEAVMNELDANDDFGLASVEDGGVGPCELLTYDIRQVGSTLCHFAEIDLPVRTRRAA